MKNDCEKVMKIEITIAKNEKVKKINGEINKEIIKKIHDEIEKI